MLSHSTHADLKKLVEEDGFKKSVVEQAKALDLSGPSGFDTVGDRANRIINNHYDLMTYRGFTLGPESAIAVTKKNLFENVGHAFHMTLAHTVSNLASTVDKEFQLLPHPKDWGDGFRMLRERRVEGYYYGSPIGLLPIGAREIFEGQACFSQAQFLSFACNHRIDWDDFRAIGMMHGVYVAAFEEFLRLTEFERPNRFDSPLIGLFLLVCDLALNPGSGFPFPVTPNFESFIFDINPGARFAILKFPTLKTAIRDYSRAEYAEITDQLYEAAREAPPLVISQLFAHWFGPTGPLSDLRQEYKSYVFKPENFVIRHLFAHFLAFQEDKFRRPEFFCVGPVLGWRASALTRILTTYSTSMGRFLVTGRTTTQFSRVFSETAMMVLCAGHLKLSISTLSFMIA
jgi:hypothetical protein